MNEQSKPSITITSTNGWDSKMLSQLLQNLPDGTIVTTNGLFKQTIRFNLPENKIVEVNIKDK